MKKEKREREESLWKIPEPFGASLAPVSRDDCPAVRKHREPWPDTLTLFNVWTGSSLPSSFPPAASFSFPFSPSAGKLGDTGGLNAAHSYVLIPVLLPDMGDLSLLDPRAPLQQEHWATLSTHSLLPVTEPDLLSGGSHSKATTVDGWQGCFLLNTWVAPCIHFRHCLWGSLSTGSVDCYKGN